MARNRRDITGHKFGFLTALEPRPDYRWLFRCDCGEELELRSNNVTHGSTKSCGCLKWRGTVDGKLDLRHDRKPQPGARTSIAGTRRDLTGLRFGHLVALEPLTGYRWLFQCDCGKTHIALSASVVSGGVKSCGCYRSAAGREVLRKVLEDAPFFSRLSFDGRSIEEWARRRGETPAQVMAALKRDKTLKDITPAPETDTGAEAKDEAPRETEDATGEADDS